MGKMFIQNFNVEADAFLGGESIHVAANRVHFARDLFRATIARTLKHHVLDKV